MDINRVDGPFPLRPQRASALPPPPALSDGSTDRVQISPQARLKAQLRGVPDIRVDRVAAIRKAIENGTYDESQRLGAAIDRLMDEMG
ncbi:MAG: flagellar biosynthesis anti-sigma factor FlgM [Planctomycetes bacterium]|nr:flagellar biosynthesis anti-sigma factor FlgM [Planctomycetota bacterium]